MNAGIIKWEVSIKATIDKKSSKKNLKEINKTISEFNSSLSDGKAYELDTKGVKIENTETGTVISSDFSAEMRSPYVLDFAFEGIKNVMKWFKIAAEDRDWDHSFIIDVLRFKIHNTCKYIEKTQRHLNWENDVRYMRLALNLIDKLWPGIETEGTSYESEYSDYHVNHFDWEELTDEEISKMEDDLGRSEDMKGSKRMNVTEVSENFDEYFGKNKLTHKKAISYLETNGRCWAEPRGKFTQALIISKLKHEKARRLFFRILEEKIETWWD